MCWPRSIKLRAPSSGVLRQYWLSASHWPLSITCCETHAKSKVGRSLVSNLRYGAASIGRAFGLASSIGAKGSRFDLLCPSRCGDPLCSRGVDQSGDANAGWLAHVEGTWQRVELGGQTASGENTIPNRAADHGRRRVDDPT